MKQIIHIYGASGSGTSMLGRQLADALGFAFMDTDDYFWMPTDPKFTVKRETSERLKLMRADMDAAENAVVSGSLTGWGDVLIPYFTLTVRVVTPTEIRIERLRAREYARFGERIRPGGDMFEQHRAFLEWAAQYDTGDANMRSKADHDLWQQKLTCRQIVVSGTDDPAENARRIVEEINTED